MATEFRISPKREGSFLHFLYRQFTFKPFAISPSEVSLQPGTTAVVTGCTGGIGLETCRQLRDLGLSHLIIAVRDEGKGHAAREELLASPGATGTIEVWKLDLASYDSIISFAERAGSSLRRLDYVILNAGITRNSFELNPSTGHELNIQINYLSQSLLALLLLPVLKARRVDSQPGRLVLLGSDVAAWGTFPEQDFDPLLPSFDRPGKIDMLDRYYTSKLLVQFFVAEVAKRVPSSVAVINAVTPGLVYGTRSLQDWDGTFKGKVQEQFKRMIGYSAQAGAHQAVDAALKHGVEVHGKYLGCQEPKPMAPIIYTPKGSQIAQRLWRETMDELSFAGFRQIINEMQS